MSHFFNLFWWRVLLISLRNNKILLMWILVHDLINKVQILFGGVINNFFVLFISWRRLRKITFYYYEWITFIKDLLCFLLFHFFSLSLIIFFSWNYSNFKPLHFLLIFQVNRLYFLQVLLEKFTSKIVWILRFFFILSTFF